MALNKGDLDQFTGSSQFYRWSALFPRYNLSEGAQYIAEKGHAFWLMDAIASWQTDTNVRREEFQVWKLTVENGSAVLTCEDGNENVIATQHIAMTDFPLGEIELWFSGNVIYLPSEH